MSIKPIGINPKKLSTEVIPFQKLNEAIRSIWWKKREQEAQEKGIPFCEAKVRVLVYLFYQYENPKPRIYIETIRPGDLIASHPIATFANLEIADQTFSQYAQHHGANPTISDTNYSLKKQIEVTF